MSWLGGPLPGNETQIGISPGNPDWQPDFSGPVWGGDIDWANMFGPKEDKSAFNPYDTADKVTDFLSQLSDEEKKNQFLDSEKLKSGVGFGSEQTDEIFKQISPNVTLTYDGVPSGINPYGSSATYGSLASGLGSAAFSLAGQNPSIAKTLGSSAANALKSKALYMINPILGGVDQFYPGGVPGAFKDVSKFAGDAFGGISKGIKSVVDWFCDERLKVDIAPLESTEVNDELAQMAFFVKGLRECS